MKPLAAALEGFGWQTLVMDNRAGLESPRSFLENAVLQAPWPNAVVIGHSGAGPFLPALAVRCDAVATVFIDAVLPGSDTPFRPSAPFTEFISALPTHDGLLPRWDTWWPADVIEDLLPDRDMRDALTVEFPRLPRRFYDRDIDIPAGWKEGACCYVSLSPAYDHECERATACGWPVRRLKGNHLDVATDSHTVAQAVVALIGELGLPASC